MNTDYALVIGIAVAVLSVPSILGAAVDGRAPRAAVFMVVIAGGLIAYASTQRPGGYGVDDVPGAVVRVVGDFIR